MRGCGSSRTCLAFGPTQWRPNSIGGNQCIRPCSGCPQHPASRGPSCAGPSASGAARYSSVRYPSHQGHRDSTSGRGAPGDRVGAALSKDLSVVLDDHRTIVEGFAEAARALGDQYLQDVLALAPGSSGEAACKLIQEADVFQLFWSSNSMRLIPPALTGARSNTKTAVVHQTHLLAVPPAARPGAWTAASRFAGIAFRQGAP